MRSAPLDALLHEIAGRLQQAPWLVVERLTGGGPMARLPAALLRAGLPAHGEIVVAKPRAIAARLEALRAAEELGERLGERVGYQARFENASSSRTRLRYLTDGALVRRLLADPMLEGVGMVVLDGFHHRHVATDLSLALLRRLQSGQRSDLRVVVSTVGPSEPLAAHLGDCRPIRVEEPADASVEHALGPDDRPLHQQVCDTVLRVVSGQGTPGDILVFLPDADEIRRSRDALGEVPAMRDVMVIMLHAELSTGEQDLVIRPSSRRKVILSTGLAEGSVALPSVTVVIDSGVGRVAVHSSARGLPLHRIRKISRAAAARRACQVTGSAHTRAIRLYTQADHDARPADDVAEIRRVDLSEVVLDLRASRVDPWRLPWFEAPEPRALESSDCLLQQLGALDRALGITALGGRMSRLPVHPRIARLLLHAIDNGNGEDAAATAAVLCEELIADPTDASSGTSDIMDAVRLLKRAQALQLDPVRLKASGMDPVRTLAAERQRVRLARLVGQEVKDKWVRKPDDPEQVGLGGILVAYPDRVARRCDPHDRRVLLSGGGQAVLAEASVVRQAEMFVAIDIERRDNAEPIIHAASAIEPEWLIDLCSDRVHERHETTWNPESERVETRSFMLYDELVLFDDVRPGGKSEEVSRMLTEAALAAGPRTFVEPQSLDRLLARMELVATVFPEAGMVPADEKQLVAALRGLCEGRHSFAELRGADLEGSIQGRLSTKQMHLLMRSAPERVMLPGGKSVRVEYQQGAPPWLVSDLQDFFGMRSGPTICEGRVALALHLLGPDRLPVAVTSDLTAFWEQEYPAIRQELASKNQRLALPEDPRLAPAPTGRRG